MQRLFIFKFYLVIPSVLKCMNIWPGYVIVSKGKQKLSFTVKSILVDNQV